MSKLRVGGDFVSVRDSVLINRRDFQDMWTLIALIEDNGYKVFLNLVGRTTSRELSIMNLETMQYLPEYTKDGNDLKYVHRVLVEFYDKVLKEKVS